MIWLEAIGIEVGVLIGFMLFLVVVVKSEDFLQKRFGKPPTWFIVIGTIAWIYVITNAVKDTIEHQRHLSPSEVSTTATREIPK